MSLLLSVIVPTLLPAAVDGVKQVIAKWTGGVRATNVEEHIKLQNADVARLEALSKLDNPYGTPSQWVVNLRASFRYVAAGVVIVSAVSTFFIDIPSELRVMALEWGSAAGFFIFGERALMNFKK